MLNYGWMGRVLLVDLGSRKTKAFTPDDEIYLKYIGGKGLCGYYLTQVGALEWDNPDCPLLFFTGPLVGTSSPTSGRMTIASRSPLTGTIGDASVGGGFATRLKRAGYDGIIFTGKSDFWVGVEIEEDQVRFEDATALLDKPVTEANGLLGNRGSTAIIGPAAEKGVRFSSLIIDRHFAAARNGIGLCFAAKRLKYVRVDGLKKVNVRNREKLEKAREDVLRLVSASSVLKGQHGISNLGTPALYDLMHTRRMMPTNNFRQTYFEHAPKLNAYTLKNRFKPKRVGCHGCTIRCKKQDGDGNPLPEFESLSHLTALIGNSDLGAAVWANNFCDEQGMDTVSAASTIACYLELTGRELEDGDLENLLEMIAGRKGVGDLLAEGSARYAEHRGRAELSMSVKGQELPAYDPRGALGMALAYTTSTRGGCHLRAYPIGHEILRKPVATNRFSFEGKARIIKIAEDTNALVDSLTACKFVFLAGSLEEYANVFEAVTGVETTATDLAKAGERIYYGERMLNAAYGFSSRDDDLPPRFFNESGTSGLGFEVPPIDRGEFIGTRSRYYRIRGLDENGMPIRKKSEELGLEWKG